MSVSAPSTFPPRWLCPTTGLPSLGAHRPQNHLRARLNILSESAVVWADCIGRVRARGCRNWPVAKIVWAGRTPSRHVCPGRRVATSSPSPPSPPSSPSSPSSLPSPSWHQSARPRRASRKNVLKTGPTESPLFSYRFLAHCVIDPRSTIHSICCQRRCVVSVRAGRLSGRRRPLRLWCPSPGIPSVLVFSTCGSRWDHLGLLVQ